MQNRDKFPAWGWGRAGQLFAHHPGFARAISQVAVGPQSAVPLDLALLQGLVQAGGHRVGHRVDATGPLAQPWIPTDVGVRYKPASSPAIRHISARTLSGPSTSTEPPKPAN